MFPVAIESATLLIYRHTLFRSGSITLRVRATKSCPRFTPPILKRVHDLSRQCRNAVNSKGFFDGYGHPLEATLFIPERISKRHQYQPSYEPDPNWEARLHR